jgi:predicted DNA-binding transcriptional regulator YafY
MRSFELRAVDFRAAEVAALRLGAAEVSTFQLGAFNPRAMEAMRRADAARQSEELDRTEAQQAGDMRASVRGGGHDAMDASAQSDSER